MMAPKLSISTDPVGLFDFTHCQIERLFLRARRKALPYLTGTVCISHKIGINPLAYNAMQLRAYFSVQLVTMRAIVKSKCAV